MLSNMVRAIRLGSRTKEVSGSNPVWCRLESCYALQGFRQFSAVTQPKIRTVSQFNLLKPTGYVMHQQFNIQQLYVLPTLYLCVLYLFENKQRLVPLTA